MVYNLLRGILYPFVFIFLIFTPKKLKFVFKRIVQDLSILDKNKEYIWVHCSSVGEINLSDALVQKILKYKTENILITVFTDTGYKTACDKYSKNNRVQILRFPLDDAFILKRIVKTISIKYLVLIETEIWPNLINIVAKDSKIILVNGRISNKSFPRYKKLTWILKPLFKKISAFCMQSEIDSDRILSLGAPIDRVFTTGNLKFDIHFEEFSEAEKNSLKSLISLGDRKLFVAGSTRKGEDQTIINVSKSLDNTLLAIVPRHLERVEEIEALIIESGLTYKKLTDIEAHIEKKSSSIDVDVILVDKMGVLRKFYSICDIAFVGGTLVNIGGHSLLEPLFYGKTPIFGPYLQNVKTISKDILNLNLGYKIKDQNEFLKAINHLETNPVSEVKIKDFFKKNQEASEKIIKIMEE